MAFWTMVLVGYISAPPTITVLAAKLAEVAETSTAKLTVAAIR
ncbi:hypothetical protein STRNTR1_0981 [Stenotrophomonas maltophilia]|nr:hypothetical protein STRNTR1_0981 [Stenotrophomonas maltophilia]